MLKFMGLMNSSWVLDGHDIATAFNLSCFQNIVDLGGKKLNDSYVHEYLCVFLWTKLFFVCMHAKRTEFLSFTCGRYSV